MNDQDGQKRLQKAMADAGLASRRKCEELILSGRVKVNGMIISELGVKVDPKRDRIEVDGKKLAPAPKLYLVMNKPKGYLTTLRDPFNRPTVKDLLPCGDRLFPVGRLDFDSDGLLIFTNDGELANGLMHPKLKVDKVYRVEVTGRPSKGEIERLRSGVEIDGRLTAPAIIKPITGKGENAVFRVIIHEGRKRQIRRMFEAVGRRVISLKRLSYGPVSLGSLKVGAVRPLAQVEIDGLKTAAGLSGRRPNA